MMNDVEIGLRFNSRASRRVLACLAVVACLFAAARVRARLSSGKQQQPCVADSHDAARLLETGGGAKPQTPPAATFGTRPVNVAPAPALIKIVTYNMRWRGGAELRAITKLLRDDPLIGGADIVGLQEVDRARKRSGNVNAARQMAEELGWNYAWAAPPADGTKRDDREAGEDETGVAILSPHPLTDVARLVLPNPGPDCRRRAAIGANVQIGRATVRVYSIHAETRIPVEQKIAQWRAVLDDLKSHPNARAVVLGDFNTIKGKDVAAARKLFTDANFTTPFSDDDTTWSTFMVALKLDWLWLRGLQAVDHGVRRTVTYSDHYPLWLTAKLADGVQSGAARVQDRAPTHSPGGNDMSRIAVRGLRSLPASLPTGNKPAIEVEIVSPNGWYVGGWFWVLWIGEIASRENVCAAGEVGAVKCFQFNAEDWGRLRQGDPLVLTWGESAQERDHTIPFAYLDKTQLDRKP